MPKALSVETRIDRVETRIAAIETLLLDEPTDPHAHGTWIVKLKSMIGHADQDWRMACKFATRDPDKARDKKLVTLDQKLTAMWKTVVGKMNHGKGPG